MAHTPHRTPAALDDRPVSALRVLAVAALLALVATLTPVVAGAFQTTQVSAQHTDEIRRLYRAFFDREPDTGGFATWTGQRARGVALPAIADSFGRSSEFNNHYGHMNDEEFVTAVYRRALQREPDPKGHSDWTARMAGGMSRGRVVYNFAQSSEFRRKFDAQTAPSTTAPPTTTAPTTTAPPPTTAPSTTVPPTTSPPPTAPAPPPDTSGPSSASAGTTVGSTQYPVPGGAIVVAPSGSDNASGSTSAPVRTLGRAIQLAPNGGTIVLRAGSYHESVNIPANKRLTIQSWPGEAVWLDGSVEVGNWVRDGNHWRRDGWNHRFDSSPTYTRGAADNTAEHWGFVNQNHPMAAHPDQVWIDGAAQRQVASRSQVGAGSFYYDESNNRLFVGSDPNGRAVRASTLQRAVRIQSNGTVIRGIGVRHYAPSVPDLGAVLLDRSDNVVLEHLAVTDSATTGISVVAANATLRNVHVARSGMLGIHGNHADNVVLDRVLTENNNLERFNTAPVSGGAKFTRLRGFTARDSIFRGNHGPGLWLDESVYDMTIVGNEMRDNQRHGISLELSARAVVADNIISNSGGFGIKINNTADVEVWNNTFVGNGRSINLVQDNRRPGSDAGRDPRRPFPDPTMTWVNQGAVFSNNVVANQRSTGNSTGNCLICVEDYSTNANRRSAEQMGVVTNGNVYNRPSGSSPSWIVVWSRGPGNPAVFSSLNSLRSDTGQETNGHHIDGPAVVNNQGAPTAAMPSVSSAVPLPANISSLIGVPTGTRQLGAWTR